MPRHRSVLRAHFDVVPLLAFLACAGCAGADGPETGPNIDQPQVPQRDGSLPETAHPDRSVPSNSRPDSSVPDASQPLPPPDAGRDADVSVAPCTGDDCLPELPAL